MSSGPPVIPRDQQPCVARFPASVRPILPRVQLPRLSPFIRHVVLRLHSTSPCGHTIVSRKLSEYIIRSLKTKHWMYIPLPSRPPTSSTPPPSARAAPAPGAIPHVISSLSHLAARWTELRRRDTTSSTNTTIGIVVGVLLGVFIISSIVFLYRYRYTVRFHSKRRRHHRHHSSKGSKTSSEGAGAPPPPPPPPPAADPPA